MHLVQRIVSNTLYVNFKKLKDENTTCLNLRWYFNFSDLIIIYVMLTSILR